MAQVIAIIIADTRRTRLGMPSLIARALAGRSVLEHTVRRAAQVPQVAKVVVVHPAGQDVAALVSGDVGKPVAYFADAGGLDDPFFAMRAAARKWALGAWRGGLGGATCYDELLPAPPMLAAMTEHGADAALILGGDWPLHDPDYARQLIDLHLEHPEHLQMTFTQAPPGLCGVVAGREFIGQLAENGPSTFGNILAYNPMRPQGDPIGRDVCVQIAAAVRSCAKRFIYDNARSAAMIDAIFSERADAAAVALAASRYEEAERFPRQVTIELTTQRLVQGPLVPQHHTAIDRAPMSTDAALKLVAGLGGAGDTAVTFGGLGDAMLHPDLGRIVRAAHDAGVMGICIETDLLGEQAEVERLLELPLDVVSIRLNADTAATYEKVMQPTVPDAFRRVTSNLQWLLNERNRRWQAGGQYAGAKAGVPWIVPRLIKTADTLKDMETFFDRWMHYTGHAVIEPAVTGVDLMPDFAPVNMAPPRRRACRQVSHRLTVLADARVARCDQDWSGRACAGSALESAVVDVWDSMKPVRQAHRAERWSELELCADCREWHRP
jgi:molybdopterin-guanine dinucleotide biosynthesis protein A